MTRLAAALLSAVLLAAAPPAVAEPIALSWDMLIPPELTDSAAPKPEGDGMRGMVAHGVGYGQSDPEGAKLVDAYNDQSVRLPGYVVPLDYDAEGTRNFLLVPFVGACVHVPPPPANQIVMVRSETPVQFTGMFQPVYVTGVFSHLDADVELAEVGYLISAERVDPYGE